MDKNAYLPEGNIWENVLSMPRSLLVNPVSTLRRQLSADLADWRLPVIYFIFSATIYLTIKWLTGYDPLDNAVQISGKPLSQTPGIKTIKLSGYFLTRHFWTFLGLFAIITGMSCRIFFAGRNIGQRKWWKIWLLLSGQMLIYSALTIPLTWLWPYFYFLPFILELLYLLPVISILSGDRLFAGLIKGFLAITFGHCLYAMALWGLATAFINLTS